MAMGLFSGLVSILCCLLGAPLQILTPLIVAVIAGVAGAFVAPWDQLRGVSGPGLGAGLGLVASLIAAPMTGLSCAVTVVVLPVAYNTGLVLSTAPGGGNAGELILMTIGGMFLGIITGILASVIQIGAAFVGTVLGVLLGIGGGAAVGAMRGQS
jgi:hypothetical protein